jgi:hypothetical protein
LNREGREREIVPVVAFTDDLLHTSPRGAGSPPTAVGSGRKGPPSQNQQQQLSAAVMKEMVQDRGYPLGHRSRPGTEREAQHHLSHWVGRHE